MKRRTFVGAAAAAVLARPALAQGAETLIFVPQGNLVSIDPVWTTATVTRNAAAMVFETLWGRDAALNPKPQMLAGALVEEDGRRWTLTLRDGLAFHDGERVLARDCVASVNRWMKRDPAGQTISERLDALEAKDDRTLVFRLKKPFAGLPAALSKTQPTPAMMPERLANTDPFKQVTDMVGSGPFRFLADERVVGSRAVYARFEGYKPRPEGVASCTSGPKIVHFDRVVWDVIPDVATAAAAMQRGEADWWEQLSFDLLPLMKKAPDLRVSVVENTGNIGLMRFNELYPPFDNPAIRRALLPALNQADYMQAIAGDNKDSWRADVGFFAPGTPMASPVGMDAITGPRDLERARREIKAAGYDGAPVVLLSPSDYPRVSALANVAADMLSQCGLNVQLQQMDWGSVIQRRASKAAPDNGGWSAFFTTFTGIDMANPAINQALRGNGTAGWFGWPTAPKLESLRDAWFAAPDLASQQRIAADIQAQAFIDVPFLPLGEFLQPTVQRRDLKGTLNGMPLFWNVRRG